MEDKAINISFEPKGLERPSVMAHSMGRDMRVSGKGRNKFGDFTLKGSLNSRTGDILMYREIFLSRSKFTKTSRKVEVDPKGCHPS